MAAKGVMRLEMDARRIGAKIFADYERYIMRWEDAEEIGEDPADDAKRFTTRHAAGRAALTHLEHLYKIAVLTAGEDAAEGVLHDLDAWRVLIAAQLEEEPATDEPGSNG
jgi:hypothetical protein